MAASAIYIEDLSEDEEIPTRRSNQLSMSAVLGSNVPSSSLFAKFAFKANVVNTQSHIPVGPEPVDIKILKPNNGLTKHTTLPNTNSKLTGFTQDTDALIEKLSDDSKPISRKRIAEDDSPVLVRAKNKRKVILASPPSPDEKSASIPEPKVCLVVDCDDDKQLNARASPELQDGSPFPIAIDDEPIEEPSPCEDIVSKCEALSARMRAALGAKLEEECFSATTENENKAGGSNGSDSLLTLVQAPDLERACGPSGSRLKPYQLVGINFLMQVHHMGVGGAILADEMGLGKTAQALAFLSCLKDRGGPDGVDPTLLVVPASLLANWARELAVWAPSLRVSTLYGETRREAREDLKEWVHHVRHPDAVNEDSDDDNNDGGEEIEDEDEDVVDLLSGEDEDEESPSTSNRAPFDVLLTCYSLFERDSVEYRVDRGLLLKARWSYLIADEAHALKNRDSLRTRKLSKVAARCPHRLLLTGTPLQNDLEELETLLRILHPEFFANGTSIVSGGTDSSDAQALAQRMRKLLGPFVLRRLKSQVASQLVEKQQVVEVVEMQEGQRQLYEEAVAGIRREAEGAKAGTSGSNGNSLVSRLSRTRINHIFTHLRKIAQHPLLVRSRYTDEQVGEMAAISYRFGLFGGNAALDRVQAELSGYSDFQLHTFAKDNARHLGSYYLPDDATFASGKVRHLADLLSSLRARGSRVLLFSQWTTVLDVLEWWVEQQGYSHVRLDGATQVAERQVLVDRFNDPANDVFVFLLSTRAGGQGLNLTGADTVILHDVDFNPQVDRQAEDRCHRLGQSRMVTVYRLVSQGTVDEAILASANRKLELDAAVLGGVTSAAEAAGKKPRKGDSEEARHMGEILAALLSK